MTLEYLYDCITVKILGDCYVTLWHNYILKGKISWNNSNHNNILYHKSVNFFKTFFGSIVIK